MSHGTMAGKFRQIAFLGNHLPRQCGIATFTTDLSGAIAAEFPTADCLVVAMNDAGKQYAYPPRVRFEVPENDLASYRVAADFLNAKKIDVVSVQHEYGIFGGKAGSYLLTLLRKLRVPIVTTLHTVLGRPDSMQRRAMNEIAQLSRRLIVMSAHGAALLHHVHGVPEHKIDIIPHGIPSVPVDGRSKHELGIEGKSVILTLDCYRRTKASNMSSTRCRRFLNVLRTRFTSCSVQPIHISKSVTARATVKASSYGRKDSA